MNVMMELVMIFGIWFVSAVSLSSLLFFVFLVNPKYLSFSGFLVFYAVAFGFFWSVLLILWRYLIKRGRARDLGGAPRQAMFLALCAVTVLFLSQMKMLNWYTGAPFGALFIFTQYILIKRG